MTSLSEPYTPRRMAGPSPYSYPDRQCRPLRPFAAPLGVLLIIHAVVCFISAIAASYIFVDPAMFADERMESADPDTDAVYLIFLSAFSLTALAERVLFFICVFFVCRFTFRAMKNLYTVGSMTPEVTPSMSAAWYFVPFAMWVMPSVAMSQIHEGSVEENGRQNQSKLVSYWWGAWLVAQAASVVTNLSFAPADIMGYAVFIAMLFLGIAALLLRVLVLRITQLQDVLMLTGKAATFD